MLKAFKLSILLTLVILVLSLISLGSIPPVHIKSGDKIGHFLAYASLTITFLVEYSRFTRWSKQRGRWLIYSLLVFTSYGVLMEFLQASSISNRNFDYFDMIANFTGVALATLLFLVLFSPLKKYFSK